MPSTTREQRGFVKSTHHSYRQKHQRGKAGGKPRRSSRNGADSDSVRSEGSILASILQCRPIPSNSGFASQFNDIVERVSSGYSSDETSSSYDSEYSSDNDDGSSYSSDSSLELEVVSRGRSTRSKRGVNSNRRRSDRRSRRSPPPSSHYRRSIQKKSKKHSRSEGKSSSANRNNPSERADAKKKQVPSPAKAKPATQTTTKPKKVAHADDETADKTRKRGNRRSDKKSHYAESALRDVRIPSHIKEEEEEDLKSDEENWNYSPSQPKRAERLGREREPFSSQNASDLANSFIKNGQHSFDEHAISHGTTKSTSLSSASSESSATSFSLNTNFNHSNSAGGKSRDHGEGRDDSSCSSNSYSSSSSSHAILQARAQTKLKEDTNAALDDIEKMNISRGSDNMPGSKSNSFCNKNGGGIQSARKELKIETAASPTDADEVSLFTTVPPGMYQV